MAQKSKHSSCAWATYQAKQTEIFALTNHEETKSIALMCGSRVCFQELSSPHYALPPLGGAIGGGIAFLFYGSYLYHIGHEPFF